MMTIQLAFLVFFTLIIGNSVLKGDYDELHTNIGFMNSVDHETITKTFGKSIVITYSWDDETLNHILLDHNKALPDKLLNIAALYDFNLLLKV